MADKACCATAALTAIYDRNVHTVASNVQLKTSIPLGTCAADERSELNPIDMMAMGLASCLLILMGKAAVAENLDIVGAKADVRYDLDNYRITAFKVDIHLPKKLAADAQTRLEAASKTCPVFLAINSDVNVSVTFNWPK